LTPFCHPPLDAFCPVSLRAVGELEIVFQIPSEFPAVFRTQRVSEGNGILIGTFSIVPTPPRYLYAAIFEIGYVQQVHPVLHLL
jgi:hypothetical protein